MESDTKEVLSEEQQKSIYRMLESSDIDTVKLALATIVSFKRPFNGIKVKYGTKEIDFGTYVIVRCYDMYEYTIYNKKGCFDILILINNVISEWKY